MELEASGPRTSGFGDETSPELVRTKIKPQEQRRDHDAGFG
jgi:hypothetical protein